MALNLKTTQEKCYDPNDSSLAFVDREDDLDFLYEGFTSRRAQMSCGHAVTPTSLTNWCRRLLDQGESKFVCGQTGCNVEWPYEEVRKMALLTPEEVEYFEKTIASIAARMDRDTKLCPGCKTSVVGKNRYNLRVFHTARSRETRELCWQCLKKRKRFTNESLKTLQTCPDIKLTSVKGVTGCPSMRACPTCGILLQHNDKYCKKVVCPRCNVGFCFVCLKLTEKCLKTSGPYTACTSGVAPRQTSIPEWHKK